MTPPLQPTSRWGAVIACVIAALFLCRGFVEPLPIRFTFEQERDYLRGLNLTRSGVYDPIGPSMGWGGANFGGAYDLLLQPALLLSERVEHLVHADRALKAGALLAASLAFAGLGPALPVAVAVLFDLQYAEVPAPCFHTTPLAAVLLLALAGFSLWWSAARWGGLLLFTIAGSLALQLHASPLPLLATLWLLAIAEATRRALRRQTKPTLLRAGLVLLLSGPLLVSFIEYADLAIRAVLSSATGAASRSYSPHSLESAVLALRCPEWWVLLGIVGLVLLRPAPAELRARTLREFWLWAVAAASSTVGYLMMSRLTEPFPQYRAPAELALLLSALHLVRLATSWMPKLPGVPLPFVGLAGCALLLASWSIPQPQARATGWRELTPLLNEWSAGESWPEGVRRLHGEALLLHQFEVSWLAAYRSAIIEQPARPASAAPQHRLVLRPGGWLDARLREARDLPQRPRAESLAHLEVRLLKPPPLWRLFPPTEADTTPAEWLYPPWMPLRTMHLWATATPEFLAWYPGLFAPDFAGWRRVQTAGTYRLQPGVEGAAAGFFYGAGDLRAVRLAGGELPFVQDGGLFFCSFPAVPPGESLALHLEHWTALDVLPWE